jgi:predicted dehydrogenase
MKSSNMDSSKPVVLAQIGCGYWGPNLIRNFSALADCRVKYVADPSPERRQYIKRNFPATIAVETPDQVLDDAEIDGVVIATPALTHFALGLAALRRGKHIFVEKPLATTVAEVDELAREAGKRKLTVMAGHTFLFNRAVRHIKGMIDRGELGDLRYIYCQRLNLGRIRSDIDALWNFGPHDISIIQYWLNGAQPLSITRHGMDYMQPGVDDVVFLNIAYPGKVMANIHVSWLDPQKTRKMVVVGSQKMVVYDDVLEDKISIFDKGIEPKAVLGEGMHFDRPGTAQFTYRSGDILLPRIDWVEPLHEEAEHFISSVRNGTEPLTGIAHARQVVDILERANRPLSPTR